MVRAPIPLEPVDSVTIPLIAPTCAALAEVGPQWLVPAHCTGWRATHALAAALPDAFVPNSVGTRFEL